MRWREEGGEEGERYAWEEMVEGKKREGRGRKDE